jgi:hypothetical protein
MMLYSHDSKPKITAFVVRGIVQYEGSAVDQSQGDGPQAPQEAEHIVELKL